MRFLKIILALAFAGMSYGIVSLADLGIEVPGTRTTENAGCGTIMLQRGESFAVDPQGGAHLAYHGHVDSFVMMSTYDFGQTWIASGVPLDSCQWATMTTDNAGWVYAAIYQEGTGIYFTRSVDQGESWSNPELIFNQASAPYLLEDPDLTWDNGILYLVCHGSDLDNPDFHYKLYLMTSDDQGETWSAPSVFAQGNFGWWQPHDVDCLDGELAVLWTERIVTEEEADTIRLCLFTSPDGGQTWESPIYPLDSLFREQTGGNFSFHRMDIAISSAAYYIAYDSRDTTFVESSYDKGQTWERQFLFKEVDITMGDGVAIETYNDLLAVLYCHDGQTWLKHSRNDGRTWSEPLLIGQSDLQHQALAAPCLGIDSSLCIHAMWDQQVDTMTAALFYYCDVSAGIGEDPAPATQPVLSAFPNPFSSSVNLQIGLDKFFATQPVIYDISGRMVRRFGRIEPGPATVFITWDGTDNHGRVTPPGSYFLQVRRGEEVQSLKIVKVN